MTLRLKSVDELPGTLRADAQAQLGGAAVQRTPPRPKYGNTAVEEGGVVFDSKLERSRYRELQQLQAAGLIEHLQVHEAFALHAPTPDGRLVRVGAYEADFAYRRRGELVVEDCKSAPTRRTAIYRWKAHHFALEYGITITEIERTHRPRKSA